MLTYTLRSGIKQWFTNGFRTREEVEEARHEKEMDKDMKDHVEADENDETELDSPSTSNSSTSGRFPPAAAKRGTSNEMQWYNSQEKFAPDGRRMSRRPGYVLGFKNSKSGGPNSSITGRTFVPLPQGPEGSEQRDANSNREFVPPSQEGFQASSAKQSGSGRLPAQ
jgi:hypothetical protein